MKVDKRKMGKQIKMVRTSKRMTQEELAERSQDADVLILNKVKITKEIIENSKK